MPNKETAESTIRNKALHLLSRRAYGTKEFTKKLIEKYPLHEHYIQSIIEDFLRLGYLNDELYILQFVRNRMKFKHKSIYVVLQELYTKGIKIDKDELQTLIPELSSWETKALEKSVLKKAQFLSLRTKKEKLQKIKESMYRKGFSMDAIEQILNTL